MTTDNDLRRTIAALLCCSVGVVAVSWLVHLLPVSDYRVPPPNLSLSTPNCTR